MIEAYDGPVPAPDDPTTSELLDQVHAVLTRYVVLPSPAAADAVVLWVAATHTLAAFQHAPRLAIKSPEKRCGKSRLLDVIAGLCHRPLLSVNATVPAIFRSIGEDVPPTLLIDEADTLWGTKRAAEQNEDLRALVNAGHQRGRPALRCVGPQQTPTEFATFAMCALAGIGDLPDTITDRAINVTMRRRRADESVSTFRTRRDGPVLDDLRRQLQLWAPSMIAGLADAEPVMPVEDRAADTWEPLVAIADLAGDGWAARARAACLQLTSEADADDEEASLNTRLLSDVRSIFTKLGATFVPAADLIGQLKVIEDAPWDEWDLNPRKLALRLKHFDVRPKRNPAGTARGYRIEDLDDAFVRYLRPNPSEASGPAESRAILSDTSNPSDTSTRQSAPTRQTDSPTGTRKLTGLTHTDAPTGRPCPGCGKPFGVDADAWVPPYTAGRCDECGRVQAVAS